MLRIINRNARWSSQIRT